MRVTGTDTSRGSVSVVHVPVPDGSCRLIPTCDLENEESCLLWTRLHALYALKTTDPPTFGGRHGPGLLANAAWATRIADIVQPKLTALSAPSKRQALNAFARLIYDYPPLIHFEPVARALASVLADRDIAFLDAIRSLATTYQRGAGSREKDTGRVRPRFVAAWEAVEEWRLQHGPRGLTAVCGEIAAKTHGGTRQEIIEREASRLERAYLRAQKHPSIRASLFILVGCQQHGSTIHPGAPSEAAPILERPADLRQAKAVFHFAYVGRLEARPPPPPS